MFVRSAQKYNNLYSRTSCVTTEHEVSSLSVKKSSIFFFVYKTERIMSGSAFKNMEESLSKHLPEAELKEVKRILYGRSDE